MKDYGGLVMFLAFWPTAIGTGYATVALCKKIGSAFGIDEDQMTFPSVIACFATVPFAVFLVSALIP